MRQYEAVVFFSSQLVGEKLEELKKGFEEQVRKQGGKVTAQREMGKRPFGYKVKRQTEGLYFVFEFDLDPTKVGDLQKSLALIEGILRFSILVKEVIPVKPAVVQHYAPHHKTTTPASSGTQTRT